MDDVSETIEDLSKFGGLAEVSEDRQFSGLLKETNEAVVITIRDNGEQREAHRYAVSAFVANAPDRLAAGNSDRTLRMAIANVHWEDLKKREP